MYGHWIPGAIVLIETTSDRLSLFCHMFTHNLYYKLSLFQYIKFKKVCRVITVRFEGIINTMISFRGSLKHFLNRLNFESYSKLALIVQNDIFSDDDKIWAVQRTLVIRFCVTEPQSSNDKRNLVGQVTSFRRNSVLYYVLFRFRILGDSCNPR